MQAFSNRIAKTNHATCFTSLIQFQTEICCIAKVVVDIQSEVTRISMQLSKVEFIPTSCQFRHIESIIPIEEDSIATSLFIFWSFWFVEFDLYICISFETYIERYTRDFIQNRFTNHFCHLLCSWQSKRFVSTEHYRTCQRQFHINNYRVCRRVDKFNCHVAIHSFESIEVDLVPFVLISFKVDTISCVHQLCAMTSIVCIIHHIKGETNSLVCSHFDIYFSHIIANEFIHHVEHLLRHYHCIVQTTRN